jgi:hypothetical protein
MDNEPKTLIEHEDLVASAHELKVRTELNIQFRELKRQALGVFAAVKGRIGARNEEYLEEVFTKAGIDYASGQFLMQRLGADRQLDLPLVATLTQLRHGLLEDIERPTTADHMLADSAVLAYRNMLRVQGWLGSLCLEAERGLFGQISPDAVLDSQELRQVQAAVEKIEHQLLPILERTQRMLCRALDRLETRGRVGRSTGVSIGVAGQVNVNG